MFRTVVATMVAALALAGCSASTGGHGAATSGAGAASGGAAAVGPPNPTAGSATTTDASMSIAQLTSFVAGGHQAAPSGYDVAADRPGVALQPNRFGDLSFRSPSGNISCDLRPAGTGRTAQVICWVAHVTHPLARVAGCNREWLPGVVTIASGSVEVGACQGDPPLLQYAHVLPYGSSLRLGALACRSDARYIACLDGAAGFLADRDAITAVSA